MVTATQTKLGRLLRGIFNIQFSSIIHMFNGKKTEMQYQSHPHQLHSKYSIIHHQLEACFGIHRRHIDIFE